MLLKNIFIRLLLLATFTIAGYLCFFCYKNYFMNSSKELFITQKPELRNIKKIVFAEGSLEAQGTSHIGSLISAKVSKIFVKEGETVTKDSLLAILENDKGGDADVRKTKAILEKAQISYNYLKKNYEREKILFESGQRSTDNFEKIRRDLLFGEKTIIEAQAAYDKEVFLFNQTQVKAPHDGIIVSIQTKTGQAFSPFTSPPQVLFKIAKSLDNMKATLLIDENKMSDIKEGMKVRIKVDAFPFSPAWKGRIESMSISQSEQKKASQQNPSAIMYEATVNIDNQSGQLRPGMNVAAEITIAKKSKILAVPGYVFQLNPKALKESAQIKSYEFKPLDPTEKKQILKQKGKHPTKTLWVLDNKSIVEKTVKIGITDNAYFEIVSGINENENIIGDDMSTSDEIKRIAQVVAGS